MSWEELRKQIAGKRNYPLFIFLVLSAALNLAFFHWLLQTKIPLVEFKKEKIIEVIPVSAEKLVFTGEPAPSPISSLTPGPTSAKPAAAAHSLSSQAPPSGKVSTGNQYTVSPGKRTPSPVSKLKAPPVDSPLPSLPDLSIYSENMQRLLRNFDQRRIGTSEAGAQGVSGIRSSVEMGSENVSGEGGEGQGFFNVRNYNLGPWAKQALSRIQEKWNIPFITKQNTEDHVEITVVIEKDGRISSMQIKKSSTVETLDQAAINALRLSSPLPQLPQDFPIENLKASLKFNYRWPSGGQNPF
ncbi:MAG: TonB family protein [Candidatus Aminicenantes bacterium]|nr:TonB family protein [Candidatus Aminicenantes bacterium]NIM85098.1 TonB family protein [Candidatus Aminicenantes bacterium]NIN24605.1 TonB family protein [Candidatus Aminicenantes bacterium]NIN48369.1 TonB family protein [Candidatus Aminicenantes bacterium]NIN91272.1 TonB family protein [Candidatus Aminicenantes bacterium]